MKKNFIYAIIVSIIFSMINTLEAMNRSTKEIFAERAAERVRSLNFLKAPSIMVKNYIEEIKLHNDPDLTLLNFRNDAILIQFDLDVLYKQQLRGNFLDISDEQIQKAEELRDKLLHEQDQFHRDVLQSKKK